MKFCKHIWDVYSRIKMIGGSQGFPCTKCEAYLEIGTMKIKEGRRQIELEKEAVE